MLVITHCKYKIEAVSINYLNVVAFTELNDALAKSKQSNELECGGIYGMMYDTYKQIYI